MLTYMVGRRQGIVIVVISGPSRRYFARPLCAHPVRTAGAFGTAVARGSMPTVGRRGLAWGRSSVKNELTSSRRDVWSDTPPNGG